MICRSKNLANEKIHLEQENAVDIFILLDCTTRQRLFSLSVTYNLIANIPVIFILPILYQFFLVFFLMWRIYIYYRSDWITIVTCTIFPRSIYFIYFSYFYYYYYLLYHLNKIKYNILKFTTRNIYPCSYQRYRQLLPDCI